MPVAQKDITRDYTIWVGDIIKAFKKAEEKGRAEARREARGETRELTSGDVTAHAIELSLDRAVKNAKLDVFERFVNEAWTSERVRVMILDRVLADQHSGPCVELALLRPSGGGRAGGRLGDPERGRGVEQAGCEVALHVAVRVTGRKSPHSLYSLKHVTFEDDAGAYDQRDAEGFIKLNALRLRLRATGQGGPKK